MYRFFLNLWVLGKIDEAQVRNACEKGLITEEEMYKILNVPQVTRS